MNYVMHEALFGKQESQESIQESQNQAKDLAKRFQNYVDKTEFRVADPSTSSYILIRPLFVGIMFFIRNFQTWNAGGWVIIIIHYRTI